MNEFKPASAYNNLPLLPPRRDVETKRVLRKCIEARSALAELKMAGELIPNQTVLINTIPLLEAKDSSEIENIVTTTDKLFQFANTNSQQIPDAATKEALRYRTALYESYEGLKSRPFSASTAVEVCSTIMGADMSIRRIPGTALANNKTKEIIYTPPEGEKNLRDKLSNWEKFLHSKSYDPLVKMAIGHYQFEAIHPFSDGNGRTGRILNLLYLVQQGILNQPVLYLSRYILARRHQYYSLLLGVTKNENWEEWLLFMLDGVLETSIWTTEKTKSIKQLIDHTKDFLRISLPKIYSQELIDIIFSQPYCRISDLMDHDIARRETASRYLKKMTEIGLLKELKTGRDKVFVHPKFLGLLLNDSHKFSMYS